MCVPSMDPLLIKSFSTELKVEYTLEDVSCQLRISSLFCFFYFLFFWNIEIPGVPPPSFYWPSLSDQTFRTIASKETTVEGRAFPLFERSHQLETRKSLPSTLSKTETFKCRVKIRLSLSRFSEGRRRTRIKEVGLVWRRFLRVNPHRIRPKGMDDSLFSNHYKRSKTSRTWKRCRSKFDGRSERAEDETFLPIPEGSVRGGTVDFLSDLVPLDV